MAKKKKASRKTNPAARHSKARTHRKKRLIKAHNRRAK